MKIFQHSVKYEAVNIISRKINMSLQHKIVEKHYNHHNNPRFLTHSARHLSSSQERCCQTIANIEMLHSRAALSKELLEGNLNCTIFFSF